MKERITSKYEHALQSVYYDIGNRGLCIDTEKLVEGEAIIDAEVQRNLAIASNQWGCIVFVGADNAPDEIDEDDEDFDPVDAYGPGGGAVNINATKGQYALLKKLQDLGYNVPKITKKNSDGDYESNYSAGELAIQKMLSENQFKYPGGDPALRAVLGIRELEKLKTSYFNARLHKYGSLDLFLSNYNVAGTLSGRRGSRRHTFGYGNNAQNFPKHSRVAYLFRRCIIPRPGNIFLFVDQIQAEDWPVSALAYNLAALADLRSGVDRHSKLASAIFGHLVPAKSDPAWNEALHDKERYLGKKCRHASNYDMTAPRMSDALAQEGFSIDISTCKGLLDKVAQIDPSVKGVFHKYVQEQISKTRTLVGPDPFFRERMFLGCRPNDHNSSIFKEAYAFIPQETVADNTGVSVLHLETEYPMEERFIVQEGHDSLAQDIPDNVDRIYTQLLRTQKVFNRTITFHNGIQIQIPIEAELGYDFHDTVKIRDFSRKGVAEVREKLQDKVKKTNATSIAIPVGA
jgi:hypothetical protein